MKFLLTLLLFTANVYALDWGDIESGEKYKLVQALQLPQTERSGSYLDLSVGDELVYKYRLGIPGLPNFIYVFDYRNCPGPQMETEPIFVPVAGTKVVVQLEQGCELNVIIEFKDVYTKSFLE